VADESASRCFDWLKLLMRARAFLYFQV